MANNFKVSVESRALMDRFKRLDASMQVVVKNVVKLHTDQIKSEIVGLLDRPATGRGKYTTRSRPGQPPRSQTGRERRSIVSKLSPSGMVGQVSTSDVAVDSKGRRYPWMLESGTRTIRKRPLFKKVQRAHKKPFGRDIYNAVNTAVRNA